MGLLRHVRQALHSANGVKLEGPSGQEASLPVATLSLPIICLKDLDQQHEDTWNIVKVGYGKDTGNHSIEDQDSDACCAVQYPAGSVNPGAKGRPQGGLGFYACPTAIFPASSVTLHYKVQFDRTFDPACGGKLPGLFLSLPGAEDTSAGSGGRMSDWHASVRLMWRTNMQAEAYVYATAARQSAGYTAIPKSHYNPEYGDSLWRGLLTFDKRGWNAVKVHVTLNTPGECDGLLAVTVNGVQQRFEQMCWRKSADIVVSAVMFSTFYGGSSEKFKAPCDTVARFKDFKLEKFAG